MKKILTLALLCAAARLAAQTDTVPPIVNCLNGLTINMQPTGMVLLWASDFVSYAEDNMTPVNQLQFAIREKGSGGGFPLDTAGNPVMNVIYGCGELGIQNIEVWARDLAGNAGWCEASLLVQDNSHYCSSDCFIDACAKVFCTGQPLPEVVFHLLNTNPNLLPPVVFKFSGGDKACGDRSIGCTIPYPYQLSARKAANPLSNSVTTTDLLLLHKQVTGIQPFTETWQWIAADADRNGKVDTADIVECRKIALALPTAIEPWRFFPETHVFPLGNPLSQPIPDFYEITAWNAPWHMGPYDFLGVRVCDLTCDAIISGTDDVLPSNAFVTSVTPNPTLSSAIFQVFLAQPETLCLEVADLSGRVLYRSEAVQPAGDVVLELPAAALPQAGVYVWRVVAGKQAASGKVVKQ